MEKKRVLVVEDELVIAVRLVKALHALGYDACEPVSSAEEAFEAIDQFSPDIVLMDIHIKGDVCGVEAATIVKQRYDIPVVFLTAFSDQATVEKAKHSEAYGYIVKPYNNETLRVNIELALSNHGKKKEAHKKSQAIDQTMSCFEDGIVTVKPDCSIELINKKLATLAGLNVQEFSRQNYSLDDVVIFYNPKNEKIDLKAALLAEHDVIKNEFICYFPYSSLRQKLAVSIHPITIDDQIFAWSIIFDLDDRKEGKASFPSKALQESEEPFPAEQKPVKYIFSKKGKKYLRICIEDILWIEALDNYVIINTLKDKFVAHTTLKNIEETLPPDDFVKVHRSYLVRIDKIDAWEDGYVIVSGKSISVSRSYKDVVKERLLLI